MNKKVLSLLICCVIVFVSSAPTDSSSDDGKSKTSSVLPHTESPKTTASVGSSVTNAAGQMAADTNGSTPSGVANEPFPTVVSQNVSDDAKNKSITTSPVPTLAPNITTPSTTSSKPTTTTTDKPGTTTIITTNPSTVPTIPTEPSKPTSTPAGTTSAATTAAAATTTPSPTSSPSKDRRFDGPSFIGGIVLSLGIMAIGFVAFKFYKARTESNYHTL